MASIDPARIRRLNAHGPGDGPYVLYWMQQSQRAAWNHALEYAIARANDARKPLVACLGLTATYPDANLRHYAFMLQGLAATSRELAARGVALVVRLGEPPDVAAELARDASLVVCDRGYLRPQKLWRKRLAAVARVEVTQVESDVIVPVDAASTKAEFAARTIRPRLLKRLGEFLHPPPRQRLAQPSLRLGLTGLDMSDVAAVLGRLDVDASVGPSPFFQGGHQRAQKVLRSFLRQGLARYAANRNQPQMDDVSHMSMYLHFGQISPLEVYMAVAGSSADGAAVAAYLEELLVRRELAQNFVNFTPHYDRYACVPAWARATLGQHRRDKRQRYTPAQLEAAQTSDPYWNASMQEMKHTGYMHNYMRMYWGKKILQWSASPQQAYATALRLNNRYFIDGRDANAYANIGWLFGLHDRPWGPRPIFGTVRYMSAEGLQRKTDPDAYVAKVQALVRAAQRARGGQLATDSDGSRQR